MSPKFLYQATRCMTKELRHIKNEITKNRFEGSKIISFGHAEFEVTMGHASGNG